MKSYSIWNNWNCWTRWSSLNRTCCSKSIKKKVSNRSVAKSTSSCKS